jgi:regulator of sigma E protease
MTWLVAILALSLLIVIHEYGHYVCARIGGMHVDRFSLLGIGPPILRFGTWKGTEFVISAIPFGAYVHIVGMEAEEMVEGAEPPPPAPEGTRNFRDSPVWARVLAIAGGPIANYLTAMAIMVGVFSIAGVNAPTETAIASFATGSPARAACLEPGDVYVDIAGSPMQGENPRQRVILATKEHLGETVPVTVLREGEQRTFDVTLNEQPPALGANFVDVDAYRDVPIGTAIADGIRWPLARTAEQLSALSSMLTGNAAGRVGGPVEIARQIKGSAERGVMDLIVFAALISTVLGMFNLLPIPALDGGRLMFMLWEVAFRRPINKIAEEWIHGIGMIALLGLLAYATVGDLRQTGPSMLDEVKDLSAFSVNCETPVKGEDVAAAIAAP